MQCNEFCRNDCNCGAPDEELRCAACQSTSDMYEDDPLCADCRWKADEADEEQAEQERRFRRTWPNYTTEPEPEHGDWGFDTQAFGDPTGIHGTANDTAGLTLDEIKQHLNRYTYKPGITLTAAKTPRPLSRWNWHPHCNLTLQTHVPNSEADNTMIITASIEIPIGIYQHSLDKAICYFIEWWENHEMREWLMFDGTRIDPPHPHQKKANLHA